MLGEQLINEEDERLSHMSPEWGIGANIFVQCARGDVLVGSMKSQLIIFGACIFEGMVLILVMSSIDSPWNEDTWWIYIDALRLIFHTLYRGILIVKILGPNGELNNSRQSTPLFGITKLLLAMSNIFGFFWGAVCGPIYFGVFLLSNRLSKGTDASAAFLGITLFFMVAHVGTSYWQVRQIRDDLAAIYGLTPINNSSNQESDDVDDSDYARAVALSIAENPYSAPTNVPPSADTGDEPVPTTNASRNSSNPPVNPEVPIRMSQRALLRQQRAMEQFEASRLRQQQDQEYEESLRIDTAEPSQTSRASEPSTSAVPDSTEEDQIQTVSIISALTARVDAYQQLKKEPSGQVVNVRARLPNGEPTTQTFGQEQPFSDLFVWLEGVSAEQQLSRLGLTDGSSDPNMLVLDSSALLENYSVVSSYPRQIFPRPEPSSNVTFAEAGIPNSANVFIEFNENSDEEDADDTDDEELYS